MPVYTVVVDSLDNKERYLRGMNMLFPGKVMDRKKHGIKDRLSTGKEPCFEIEAPAEIEETVYNARHSPFWEGIDVQDVFNGMRDIIPGHIGEQEKHIDHCYGHVGPNRAKREFAKVFETDKNSNQRGIWSIWEPVRSERLKIVPEDQFEQAYERLSEEFELNLNAICALADASQDLTGPLKGKLPMPWTKEFAKRTKNITPKQREMFASLCAAQFLSICQHQGGTEKGIEYDLEDLDDGRVLVVLTPTGIKFPCPHIYRLINELFPQEEDAGDTGKAVLGSMDQVEALIKSWGAKRINMKKALARARKDLENEESDLRESGLIAQVSDK